jgi:UDP-3-O-[3-hydroxymyristoyl] glucosamine N-acyltransferase
MSTATHNVIIDPSASVGNDVHFGNNITINARSTIGKNVKLGNNVTIYENVVIDEDTVVWDNAVIGRVPMGVSTIYSKVEIKSDITKVGKGCVIGCGAVLYAGIKIGNCCLVGDNSVIRENSILEDNIIIGPVVFIQKNCKVGEKTRIIQQSSLASGTVIGKNNFISSGFTCVSDNTFGVGGYSDKKYGPKIGDNNLIGPNVTMLDNIEIGNDNLIGAKALITKTIGNNGVYFGIPGKFVRKRYEERN